MKDLNEPIFAHLFKEACEKCFGTALTSPLSETESKVLSNKILEQTGLVIGVKSIKNYSIYILSPQDGKKENPSIATLDTFARYVLNAPYTDEVKRKENEGHHPYWFTYKSKFNGVTDPPATGNKRSTRMVKLAVAVVIGVVFYVVFSPTGRFAIKNMNEHFFEEFNYIREDTLIMREWFVQHRDTAWWNKRWQRPGHLSLFTLRGDNWPSNTEPGRIKNLLVHPIKPECFTAEVHLSDFFPQQNWQQAGILLSEDTSFQNKVVRLSISYNDFFGGYTKTPEIIIQGVSSVESGSRSKPEEFAHTVLFNIEAGQEHLVKQNMKKCALKIEKKGNHFRFLYTAGSLESFAFKEVVAKDFAIKPKYIALFAIQGFSGGNNYELAHFDAFSFDKIDCE